MGYVKKTIKELTRMAGSKTEAKKQAEDWFQKSKKKLNEKEVSNWSDRFLPGKIYVFRYDNPITKGTLDWWDQNPVVLALVSTTSNDIGVNLNLLPIQVKEELLDRVYSMYEGSIKTKSMGSDKANALRQRGINLKYEDMASFLRRTGFEFAIRQYIPFRKTNQHVVAYESWPKIALCDFADLNGTTIGAIKWRFTNHLRKKNI